MRGADAAEWRTLLESTERLLPWYDRVNFANTFGRVPGWRRRVASTAGRGDVALEVGSGPGSFARHLMARRVVCLDPSRTMLAASRRSLGPSCGFVSGVGEHLPLRAASVDKAYCSFAFRQFPDKHAAIREVARVLRPGGEFHVLDAARPPPGLRRAFMDTWLGVGVPAVVALLVPRRVRRTWPEPPFASFVRSYRSMEPPEAYAEAMRASGFSPVVLEYLSMRSVFHLWGVRSSTT